MARFAGNTRTAPQLACVPQICAISPGHPGAVRRNLPVIHTHCSATRPHSADPRNLPWPSGRCSARFAGNARTAPQLACVPQICAISPGRSCAAWRDPPVIRAPLLRGLHLRRIPRRSGADVCPTQRLSAQRRSGASDAEDRHSRSKQSRFIHPAFQMISPAQNRLCNRARRRVRRVRTGASSVGKPWAFRFSPAAFRSMKLLFRHAKMPAALLGWHFCLRKRTRRAPFSQERSALREASVIPR